jgi:hypothetical protein
VLSVLAVVLLIVGSAVVGTSARLLWESRPDERARFDPGCDMPSPEGKSCTDTMAHVGWHHRSGKQWYGDVYAPPAPNPKPKPQPASRWHQTASSPVSRCTACSMVVNGVPAFSGR